MTRVRALDALRGVAVALMAWSHFVFFAYPGEQLLGAWSGLDLAAFLGARVLVHGKVTALFALVFGYAAALQLRGLDRRGIDARRFMLRRSALLVGIGAVHSLVWSGDILLVYGLAGVVLALCLRARPGVLAGVGGALWALFVAFMVAIAPYIELPAGGALPGTLVERLAAMLGSVTTPANAYVLGAMLLGFALGRWRVHAGGRLVWLAGITAGAVWAVASVGGILAYLGGDAAAVWISYAVGTLPGGVFYLLVGLGMLHAGGRWVEAYGRVALSNYLVQTAALVGIFQVGQLAGFVGPAAALLMGACVVAVQVFWSRWVLWSHGSGPVEAWLRRRLLGPGRETEDLLVAFARGR